jgi:uncharacterized membrane protein YkoI
MRSMVASAALLALVSSPAAAKDDCTHSWARGGRLKSFKQIESEVQTQAAGSRILRVALCKDGENKYFQVKVISTGGSVRSMRIEAE